MDLSSSPGQGPLRRLVAALLLPLAGYAVLSACTVEAKEPRPDLVVFVVDTLRADRLGCYGYGRPTSPNIDALAARGALFERNWAQSSWTMPSMIALVTGRYVTDYRDRVLEDAPTLAELLKDEGYRTVGIVANGLLRPSHGYARGFDHYDVHSGRAERRRDLPPYRTAQETLEAFDVAVQELERSDGRGRRAPYFLYVHLMDPHSPYRPAPEFDDELPLDGAPAIASDGWHRDRYAELVDDLRPWEPGLAVMNLDRAVYEQEIRRADEALGLMLQDLERRGLLGNAVVAVASDHGEGLHDHLLPVPEGGVPGRRKKPEHLFLREHGNHLYGELVSTPLVLAGPGVPAGLRVDEPVENVDLMPSLLELLGVELPAGLAGRSLLPVMQGGPGRDTQHAWVHQAAAIHDARTGWKLEVPTTFGRGRGGRPMLFHLPSDPSERDDRIAAEPALALELEARLNAWIAAHPTPSSLHGEADPLVVESLVDLGYVDAGIAPGFEAGGALAQPADAETSD